MFMFVVTYICPNSCTKCGSSNHQWGPILCMKIWGQIGLLSHSQLTGTLTWGKSKCFVRSQIIYSNIPIRKISHSLKNNQKHYDLPELIHKNTNVQAFRQTALLDVIRHIVKDKLLQLIDNNISHNYKNW